MNIMRIKHAIMLYSTGYKVYGRRMTTVSRGKHMKLRLVLWGATALVLSAPVFAQSSNVEGRVVKLEKEMRSVQRQVFPGGTGKFFEPEISPANAAKANTAAPSNTAVADLIARVDALEAQLATLTGQVEQQGNTQRSLDTRLKAVESQLKAQATAPEPVAMATPTSKPTTAAPTSKPSAKPVLSVPAGKPSAARTAAVAAIGKPASGDSFSDGYDYGYRLWEAKFFPEAQVQLDEIVKKYPKHARISYARNLLGRAWLDDKKPATAVKIFYDNYKLDPRGDRAPESLYFLGSALTDLGKTTEACEAFGQLATAYPAESKDRLAARVASGRTRAKCK
jgi:TolA-binding protein